MSLYIIVVDPPDHFERDTDPEFGFGKPDRFRSDLKSVLDLFFFYSALIFLIVLFIG